VPALIFLSYKGKRRSVIMTQDNKKATKVTEVTKTFSWNDILRASDEAKLIKRGYGAGALSRYKDDGLPVTLVWKPEKNPTVVIKALGLLLEVENYGGMQYEHISIYADLPGSAEGILGVEGNLPSLQGSIELDYSRDEEEGYWYSLPIGLSRKTVAKLLILASMLASENQVLPNFIQQVNWMVGRLKLGKGYKGERPVAMFALPPEVEQLQNTKVRYLREPARLRGIAEMRGRGILDQEAQQIRSQISAACSYTEQAGNICDKIDKLRPATALAKHQLACAEKALESIEALNADDVLYIAKQVVESNISRLRKEVEANERRMPELKKKFEALLQEFVSECQRIDTGTFRELIEATLGITIAA
jgi:hypothetical protein